MGPEFEDAAVDFAVIRTFAAHLDAAQQTKDSHPDGAVNVLWRKIRQP